MSGLTGSSERVSGTPGDIAGLRKGLSGFLSNYGYAKGLFPNVVPDAASLEPYLQTFTERNKTLLGQAKESAGNLTGSGFANTLGLAAGRAATEQGAFLADLMERRRLNDQQTFMNLVLGLGTSGVGPDTLAYTPGLIDYAAQGALGLASGGAFNKLIGGGKA